MTLNQLLDGQSANVVDIAVDQKSLAFRCQSLGITPGCAIEVLRRAPAKGPLQVKVLNTLYSIRSSDAAHIRVSPV